MSDDPLADVAFPNNVVEALKIEFDTIDDVDLVVKRSTRTNDPSPVIGIYADDWIPADFNIGLSGPAIARYLFEVCAQVKHTNEEDGLAAHAFLSKRIRSMLYLSQSLRVRLSQLQETSSGVTERTSRWGVQRQKFMSGEVQGEFIYLSVIEFWLETEAV